jgi:hypothetical protein
LQLDFPGHQRDDSRGLVILGQAHDSRRASSEAVVAPLRQGDHSAI